LTANHSTDILTRQSGEETIQLSTAQ